MEGERDRGGIPYSQKYWWELNLAVEPKIAIARTNIRFKFGSSVRDHRMYTVYVSRKFWRILIPRQIFRLYGMYLS